MNSANPEQTFQEEICDLCVIGAGIAGLNTLFAASQYLENDSRVILIDSKLAPGGMWDETYDSHEKIFIDDDYDTQVICRPLDAGKQ